MYDVKQEVIDLHDFFVGWFAGTIPNTDEAYASGFTDRCDDGFILIPPAGGLTQLSDLASGLRGGYGNNPDFRIQVRNVEVRHATDDLVIATYEEWQRNAKSSTPSDNGRVSTAVFRPDPSASNGLRWLHVHETWLPSEVMAAGPFDF